MGYQRFMGYPPYPNSGRAKKYGVPGIIGYQDLWVKGTSTVLLGGVISRKQIGSEASEPGRSSVGYLGCAQRLPWLQVAAVAAPNFNFSYKS